LIKKIAVIGLGAVGKSISLTLAQKNYVVVVITRRGHEGFKNLCKFVETVEKHESLKNKSEVLSRISWFNDFCDESRNCDLAIEAISENLREKQQLFKKMDKFFSPNVILSSVTS
jgi:3-hydroxybutyryl-CoA dehydrogenase